MSEFEPPPPFRKDNLHTYGPHAPLQLHLSQLIHAYMKKFISVMEGVKPQVF